VCLPADKRIEWSAGRQSGDFTNHRCGTRREATDTPYVAGETENVDLVPPTYDIAFVLPMLAAALGGS
jgi:hypothetical protein